MPVTSALNICMPPEWFSRGTTASVNRMIPMPPIHCIKALHRWIPWPIPSTLGRMDAPVVVNPDTASKNASDIPMGREHSMKGSSPNSDSTIQTEAVSR